MICVQISSSIYLYCYFQVNPCVHYRVPSRVTPEIHSPFARCEIIKFCAPFPSLIISNCEIFLGILVFQIFPVAESVHYLVCIVVCTYIFLSVCTG